MIVLSLFGIELRALGFELRKVNYKLVTAISAIVINYVIVPTKIDNELKQLFYFVS
jgi:hypothetical protein